MADVNSTLTDVCNEIALALQKKLNTTNKFKPINYAARVLDIGSNANATASDVKLGKKVYVVDNYVDGTFTGEDVTVQNENVGVAQVELTPESGKYYQKVIIPAQPGLIAANIRKGVTIFGVTGTLEEQTTPKLATPQNVTVDGTTVSWDHVEHAENYDVYADDTVLLGNTTGG